MTIELIGWWVVAAVAVICAIGMLASRNPVHSALWLVGNFIAMAVIYLMMSAPVLFAIQLIVYAGAIMVLFLFVVMFFMSPKALRFLRPPLRGQLVLGGVLAVVLLLLIVFAGLGLGADSFMVEQPGTVGIRELAATDAAADMGNPRPLGEWLFSYHMLPFELTSVLLLIAMVGALMVARDIRSEGRDLLPDTAPLAREDEAGAKEVR
jgi:NADH-quinone oxidoreductase subunit J